MIFIFLFLFIVLVLIHILNYYILEDILCIEVGLWCPALLEIQRHNGSNFFNIYVVHIYVIMDSILSGRGDNHWIKQTSKHVNDRDSRPKSWPHQLYYVGSNKNRKRIRQQKIDFRGQIPFTGRQAKTIWKNVWYQ